MIEAERNPTLERMNALRDQLRDLLWGDTWALRFRQWLAAQDRDAEIGLAVTNHSCPIARYVRARIGDAGLTTQVSYSDVRLLEGDENPRCLADIRLSPLAQMFVMKVDRSRCEGDSITAEEAMQALDAAEAMATGWTGA